jgi:type IV pilus assembly protein PilP
VIRALGFSALFFALSASLWAQEPISQFFKDKTKIENPFDLRDPFKAPQMKMEKTKDKGGYFSSGTGQYSNRKEEPIKDINEIKLMGVLIGKERRALVNIKGNKEVIILKEGMKIGQDGIELKAILPGGIVLVEKIVNVYGQEEYLETVIPISR